MADTAQIADDAKRFLASFQNVTRFANAVVDFELSDATIASMNTEIDNKTKQISDLKEQIDVLQHDVTALNSQRALAVSDAKTAGADAKAEADAYKVKVQDDIDAARVKAQADNQALVDAAKAQVASAQNDLAVIRGSISARQVELDKLEQAIADLKTRFA